jgi:hypothetical protein
MLKWKLDSFHLDKVLILTLDRCTVCTKHTMGSKIIFDAPDGTTGEWVGSNLILVRLEIVLVSMQYRCGVCPIHTLGSEIILDAPDGTPR